VKFNVNANQTQTHTDNYILTTRWRDLRIFAVTTLPAGKTALRSSKKYLDSRPCKTLPTIWDEKLKQSTNDGECNSLSFYQAASSQFLHVHHRLGYTPIVFLDNTFGTAKFSCLETDDSPTVSNLIRSRATNMPENE